MSNCPDDLRRLYREGRIIPFVGAGASMSVQWGDSPNLKSGPSWAQLVDQASRILGADYPDLLRLRGTDLQILEYFNITKGGLAELTNWLSNQFSQTNDSEIDASPLFHALGKLNKCNLYYTTNYDDFLERSLRSSGRKTSVITSEHTMNHDRQSVEVVKFHGDFNSPQEMVLSESQYMNRMRLESSLDFNYDPICWAVPYYFWDTAFATRTSPIFFTQ